jgi:hypothetical protein
MRRVSRRPFVGKVHPMGPGQRLDLLDDIPDTGEIVIVMTSPRGADDELLLAWRGARDEANTALETWRLQRTRGAFAAFRAAEDRADAAQDALASRRSL